MAVSRFASGKPVANTDLMLYSVERSSLISIVAVNLSGATKITAWVIPNTQESNPDQWIYFINKVELRSRNTFETFKLAVNVGDKVYVTSESGNVTFFVNGIYDTTGTTDVNVGPEPEIKQVGTLWINTNVEPNETLFWDGEQWQAAGTEGPPGPANTLTIGSVTAVGPFDEPSATITGTSPNQFLNLVLQQGPVGPEGNFIVSDSPPPLPIEGNVWFDTSSGRFFVYYDSYWIETSSNEAGPKGDTGPVWQPYWVNVSSDYQTFDEDGLFLDSRDGSFTVFLNSSPKEGDAITLVDASSSLGIRSVTVDGSGKKILGKDGILILNVKDAAVMLIYVNEEIGWKVT